MTRKTTKKKSTRKTIQKSPKKIGRPTKSNPEKRAMALILAQKGKTNEEIASFLNVATRTLANWRAGDPDFMHAMRNAKEEADMLVENALFASAVGFSRMVKKQVASKVTGEVYEVHEEEYIKPDPRAQMLWLKNRQPDKWRDKQEVEHKADGEKLKAVIILPDNGKQAQAIEGVDIEGTDDD